MRSPIPIKIRNNLDHPIRLTVTISSSGRNDDQILITVGQKGATLKQWYGVCIDRDLEPNKSWDDAGSLTIEPNYFLTIKGEEEEGES